MGSAAQPPGGPRDTDAGAGWAGANDAWEQGPASDGSGAIFADINITPLVDVVLVLLIIFVVSSSAMVDAVREGRLDLTLPQAGEAQASSPETAVLVIGMGTDGQVYLHGKAVQDQDIASELEALHAEAPQTVVVIDADGKLSHASVVHMLDRVRQAGFASVGIGAEQTP